MLKNWTVITQPIKDQSLGLKKFLRYLVSESHKNHKNKTAIKPIFGNIDRFHLKTVFNITKQELITAKKKKGGRGFNSFAQSFVFSLPPDLPNKITHQQWQNISKDIIKELSLFLNLTPQHLKDHLFMNLHEQDNPHLNLVIAKVINGITRTELQQKSIIKVLKHAFNLAVLQHTGLDHTQYQPKTRRKKRYGKHFYDNNKQVINTLSQCSKNSTTSTQSTCSQGTSNDLKTLNTLNTRGERKTTKRKLT